MFSYARLAGIAATLAAGIAGLTLFSAGDSIQALAAPAAIAPAAPSRPAQPAAARPAEAARETGAVQPATDCARQAWPYVARECLAAADGTPVRKVSRTINLGAR